MIQNLVIHIRPYDFAVDFAACRLDLLLDVAHWP